MPFCIKRCNYCDFISNSYDAGLAASYVYALTREIRKYDDCLNDEQRIVKSIYIGGGTPTVLSGVQLATILDACRKLFVLDDDAEITIECNPGTVNFDKLNLIKNAGVNRISIGVQAYQHNLLARLGRIHNWQDVVEAVRCSKEAGFDNISLDLIFGIPGQIMADWQESLERVLDLSPQHISTYNLKIETGTSLHRDVSGGKISPCDEDLELEMFWYTADFLKNQGFRHYEISNYALLGREARHNMIYWLNREYLGLGPAAHSMLEGRRFSNEESVELYINKINENLLPVCATSKISTEDSMAETVFLGLRMIDGLDIHAFKQKYGCSVNDVFAIQLKKLCGLGLIEIGKNYLRLSKKGLPLANEVFVEFI